MICSHKHCPRPVFQTVAIPQGLNKKVIYKNLCRDHWLDHQYDPIEFPYDQIPAVKIHKEEESA